MKTITIATGDGNTVTWTKDGDGLKTALITEAGVLVIMGEVIALAAYIPGAWLNFVTEPLDA